VWQGRAEDAGNASGVLGSGDHSDDARDEDYEEELDIGSQPALRATTVSLNDNQGVTITVMDVRASTNISGLQANN